MTAGAAAAQFNTLGGQLSALKNQFIATLQRSVMADLAGALKDV